jgi:hypothetical protein
MNDIFGDPKSIIVGLIGAVMALLAWIGRRELERVKGDNQSLRDDMERRHKENIDRLDRIETGVTDTHRRIDDLYRDLLDQK